VDLLRPTRSEWVERAILGNLRRVSGNPVEIGKITVSQFQKKGFKISDAQKGCVAGGDADGKIEADDCGSSFTNLVLYPIQEPE
jgi:hypothetical protein